MTVGGDDAMVRCSYHNPHARWLNDRHTDLHRRVETPECMSAGRHYLVTTARHDVVLDGPVSHYERYRLLAVVPKVICIACNHARQRHRIREDAGGAQ